MRLVRSPSLRDRSRPRRARARPEPGRVRPRPDAAVHHPARHHPVRVHLQRVRDDHQRDAARAARIGTVYMYDSGLSKSQNDLARNNAIKTTLSSSMNLLIKTSPNFTTSSTWTQSGLTFTNGDLIVTYVVPVGITDTDARVGQQVTVRATYHQDLVIPLDQQLPAQGRGRPPGPDQRSHDGRQLMIPWSATRRRRRGEPRERGQVLVIVVFGMVALMAAAGLAFDVGRFYSERRFLQNAADAGALAVANALIRGETNADAEAEGRDILARNLTGSPTGSTATVATTPVYTPGHAGDPSYLQSRHPHQRRRRPGRGLEPGHLHVRAGHRARLQHHRRPGASGRPSATCCRSPSATTSTRRDRSPARPRRATATPNHFQDLVATANTSCLGSSSDRVAALHAEPRRRVQPLERPATTRSTTARSSPSSARARIPRTRPASAASSPSTSATSRARRRRPTSSTTGSRRAPTPTPSRPWRPAGSRPAIPGRTSRRSPSRPTRTTRSASSTATRRASSSTRSTIRYAPGAEILAAVYSGTVQSIPDFTYAVPSTATINTNQNRNNSVTMSVDQEQRVHRRRVDHGIQGLERPRQSVRDDAQRADLQPLAAHPERHGHLVDLPDHRRAAGRLHRLGPGPFVQPGPARPLLPGRHLDRQRQPRLLRERGRHGLAGLDGRHRDDARSSVSTPNNNGTYFNGTVALSVEGGADANGVLPAGIGAAERQPDRRSPSTRAPARPSRCPSNGGTLGPGVYPLTLRVTGTNGSGQPVTRLVPITLTIATASTSSEYVDILGFTSSASPRSTRTPSTATPSRACTPT